MRTSNKRAFAFLIPGLRARARRRASYKDAIRAERALSGRGSNRPHMDAVSNLTTHTPVTRIALATGAKLPTLNQDDLLLVPRSEEHTSELQSHGLISYA